MIFGGSEPVQSFAYERKGNSAVIRRCFSRDTIAVIPDRIDGLTVTELAPYAFSAHLDRNAFERELAQGRICISRSMIYDPDNVQGVDNRSSLPELMGEQLEEIELPETLIRAGRYCFYNCSRLKRISFTSRQKDWGSGTFTGCHKIREIQVRMYENETSILKDMLDEVLEEVRITVTDGEGNHPVRLLIPEFYEEGIENYEARIIDTRIHGAGMRYRNCFRDRKIDYAQYDRMFAYAVAQEADECSVSMALCRLLYPHELGAVAEARYQACLLRSPQIAAECVLRERSTETIRRTLELYSAAADPAAGSADGKITDGENIGKVDGTAALSAFLDALIEKAGRQDYPEALSLAMEARHALSPEKSGEKKRRRRMEL